jgi:hypothetical protein
VSIPPRCACDVCKNREQPDGGMPVAYLRSITHPDWLEVCERDSAGAFPVYAALSPRDIPPSALSISMEDADEDGYYTAEELLAAIHACGFEPRRASTGHVFLLCVEEEVAA